MRSALLLLLLGCAPGELDPDDPIAIFETRCLGCHRPDGVWPPLHDTDVLSGLAPLAHRAVESRSMPPWAPGEGPVLHGSLALPEPERASLLGWLQARAPLPDPDALQIPERSPLQAELQLPIPEHAVSGDQDRCFLVDLPGDRALTGYDLRGNELVHHALLGLYPDQERARLLARDQADPGPGWHCPDAFMPSAEPAPEAVPIRWFPHPEPTRFTPGTGVPLTRTAVLQIHGLGSGTAAGTLSLALADPDQVLPQADLVLGTADVPLPRDQTRVVVEQRAFVGSLLQERMPGDDDVWIVGARGHGHAQLDRLTLALDDEPVLDLIRYDPAIQPRYRLAHPLRAPRDAIVSLTCVYDNSAEARERAELYGDEGEMCGGWIHVTAERPPR